MKELITQFVLSLPFKLREEDKIRHMVWSFWLTLASLVFWSPSLAFAAVFLIGFAKECWDYRYGSGFCVFDLTGNVLGSLVALLLGLAITTLFM